MQISWFSGSTHTLQDGHPLNLCVGASLQNRGGGGNPATHFVGALRSLQIIMFILAVLSPFCSGILLFRKWAAKLHTTMGGFCTTAM